MTDIYRQSTGVGGGLLPLWGLPTTATTTQCDNQGEGVAFVFTMPVDDTITQIGFVNASKTVVTALAVDTWTAGIQGLTTGGLPDDTYLGGATAKVTFPNATYPESGFGTGTYHFLALGTPIALQGGTRYSGVVQKSGADDLVNFLTFRSGQTSGNFSTLAPYTAQAAAGAPGAWTKSGTIVPMYFALRSATRTYLFPCLTNRVASTVGTTTESGFSFTMPAGYGASNSVGLRGLVNFHNTALAAAGTYTVNLYSAPLTAPVILQTTGQLDSDFVAGSATNRVGEILFPEDTLSALVPGTKYGVGYSMSGAGGFGISTMTLPDAGSRDAWDFGGFTFMTRTLASAYPPDNSDGAFTETTTTIVIAELILGDFTAAAAGGGMVRVIT